MRLIRKNTMTVNIISAISADHSYRERFANTNIMFIIVTVYYGRLSLSLGWEGGSFKSKTYLTNGTFGGDYCPS